MPALESWDDVVSNKTTRSQGNLLRFIFLLLGRLAGEAHNQHAEDEGGEK